MTDIAQIEQQLRAVRDIVRGAREALATVAVPARAPMVAHEVDTAGHHLKVATLALENALVLRLPGVSR